MSSKPWIPWYSSDYRAKTAHLSFIESEAYRRLIEAYYERRGPLPADHGALCRLTSAQDDPEKEAVRRVSQEFFTEGGGELHQARCDEELSKRKAYADAQAERANKRWHSDGNASADAKAMPKGMPERCLPLSQSYTTVTTTTKKSKPLAPSDKPLDAADPVNGVCYIPLADKTEFAVPQALLTELEAAYPAVDGPATLKEIRAWCVTNPSRCKTRRGVARFINRWFQKVQDHG